MNAKEAQAAIEKLNNELVATTNDWAEDDTDAALRWRQADVMVEAAHIHMERGEWQRAYDAAQSGWTILNGD